MTEKKNPEPDAWDRLRKPFPPESISKLPKGNVQLDYVGHAAVTDRLLSVDKDWNWEPLAFGEDGLPRIAVREKELELWIRITILGKSMLAVGTCQKGAFDPSKQLISDAIRNGAMRFGVALDLWSKDELESVIDERRSHAGVDRRTGELRADQPKPPAGQPKGAPPASQPAEPPAAAPDDMVASIDVSAVPPIERDDKMRLIVWGVPVTAKVWDSWDKWKDKYVYDDAKLRASSSSVLTDHTWQTAIEGSESGKRERALRWRVAKAAENVRNKRTTRDGDPFLADQYAARALFVMVDARLNPFPPGTTGDAVSDPDAVPF